MPRRRDYRAERERRDYRAQQQGYSSYSQFRNATQRRPAQLRALSDEQVIARATARNANIELVIPNFPNLPPSEQANLSEAYLLSMLTHDRTDDARILRAGLVAKVKEGDFGVVNWKSFKEIYNANFTGGNESARRRIQFDKFGNVIDGEPPTHGVNAD